MFFSNGEIFGCEATAEGVAGIHGAGAFVPAVAVGRCIDGGGRRLEGGEFQKEITIRGQSAFWEPVVGLQKDEPFSPGEKGAAIHGVVEPAVTSAMDGQVRKRGGNLKCSIGRAAIHNQVLALNPLPHGTADGVLECRGGVKSGSDYGEKRCGG